MPATLLRRAARLLSPDSPNRALARLVGRRRSTVRSWLYGHRQMPLKHFPELEAELAGRIPEYYAIIQELKQAAWLRQRQRTTPVRRGFLEVKERDGPGTPLRDARWRGGRPRKR